MKTVAIALAALIAGALLLVAGGWFALRAALAPLPGEWTVPVTLGPFSLPAGVPTLARLTTTPWIAQQLAGQQLRTRFGRLTFATTGDGALAVRCAPCVLHVPALGEQPLHLAEAQVSVHRLGESLWGDFRSGAVHGEWQGRMARSHIQVSVTIAQTPLADGFALFGSALPEVKQARIAGTFSLQAQGSLPAGTLTVQPRIEGFEVGGLGTEALIGARSSCDGATSRLAADSWLARAVIAAEDQRFHEHTGYDLAELSASLALNHATEQTVRGASTLSQQVAKLLVTGSDRSPLRKLRELLYAVEMERTLGKPRILRLYLDNAPWGDGVCGAEAAARHYFGKRAHLLTPAEASWLAAMLHNPELEAARWAASGQIHLARAQWVAMHLRGMPRAGKLALADSLAQVDWKPPPGPHR